MHLSKTPWIEQEKIEIPDSSKFQNTGSRGLNLFCLAGPLLRLSFGCVVSFANQIFESKTKALWRGETGEASQIE